MNDLLRDMIEAGDVAAFIDDVIVGTETEERYDDIVENILRRIEENNLFVKLGKYIWKVREVGFLGVVIEPDRVKIKKEKVQGVVDWLVFVVATTHQNGTCSMLTSAKLSVSYLVVEITRELNKEPSLHCFSIYINTMWSMLQ